MYVAAEGEAYYKTGTRDTILLVMKLVLENLDQNCGMGGYFCKYWKFQVNSDKFIEKI